MPGPLHGIKVVEFTEIIAGPLAGMLLADMGAEVIKVEPPWGDPWRLIQSFSATESRPFLAYNRGKQSLTLDLTKQRASEILRKLIPEADVVIANYRPDVAVKLGVDYETLNKINPLLIYCENTAFGRQGPDANRPGYDIIIQAMSGLMASEGKLSGESPEHIWSSPMVDTTAGFCLAWSICGALFARERTGKGQMIETTLMGSALMLLGSRISQVESMDFTYRKDTVETLSAMRLAGISIKEIPEIYQMQCQAIFEALAECKKKKIKPVIPEIMIPLVSTASEIKILGSLVKKTAEEIQKIHSIKIKYYVGTMIELPRAALRAKDIAKYADFFSFGTNDLTQTTFGISRDDSGKFLNDYVENNIFYEDPFVSIDERGVGELIKIATERGRMQKKSLKLGICGEHGGDPASIEFCEKVKLNYVSCSPYRVPIARLAAAQAYLKKKK